MIDFNLLMQTIFTTKNIIIYFVVINLLAFLIMWWDKHEAKLGDWRVSEKFLFLLVLLGGGIGGIAGMYTFRHKTQKLNFVIRLSIYNYIRNNISTLFTIKITKNE